MEPLRQSAKGPHGLGQMRIKHTGSAPLDEPIQHLARQHLVDMPALIARTDAAPVRIAPHEFVYGSAVSQCRVAQRLVRTMHGVFRIAGPSEPLFGQFLEQRLP